MTPGLQRGPPFPSKATKDAIVAVASLERPSVPIVVGICEIDVTSLKQVQGAKGHAVRGEHWDGDELWSWSSAGKPGGSAPEHIDGWDTEDVDAAPANGVEQLTVDDQDEDTEEGGVQLDNGANEKAKVDPRNEFVEGEDAKPYEEIGKDDKELSTKGTAHFWGPRESYADDLQRSMTSSGTPSYMESTTTAMPTGVIRMKVLISPYISLLSFPILYCHISQLSLLSRHPRYKSKRRAGRMQRSSSRLWTRRSF